MKRMPLALKAAHHRSNTIRDKQGRLTIPPPTQCFHRHPLTSLVLSVCISVGVVVIIPLESRPEHSLPTQPRNIHPASLLGRCYQVHSRTICEKPGSASLCERAGGDLVHGCGSEEAQAVPFAVRIVPGNSVHRRRSIVSASHGIEKGPRVALRGPGPSPNPADHVFRRVMKRIVPTTTEPQEKAAKETDREHVFNQSSKSILHLRLEVVHRH